MVLTVNEYIIVHLLGIILWTGIVYAINYSDIYLKRYHVIFALLALFTGFLISDFVSALLFDFFWGIFVVIFLFIIPSKFNQNKKEKLFKDRSYTVQIVVMNLYNIASSISLQSLVQVNNSFERCIIWIPFFAMLFIENYIILSARKKNQELEKQIAVINQYGPLIDVMGEEIKIRQHDYDNHLNTIIGMIENNKYSIETYDEINQYIYSMEDEGYIGDLVKLHNRIIAGFLYSKKKYAEKNGIELKLVLNDFEIKSKLKDYELIDMLSVLVDNAFETNTENNHVIIVFDKKDKNIISVANKYQKVNNEELKNYFQKGYTSKKGSNNGIGLYKVQKIIKKHKGELMVQNKSICGTNYLEFKIVV
jgi:hypothetical protein